MISQLIWPRRKQILIDINTQNDFLDAEGHRPVRHSRRVFLNIRRVFAWARKKDIPVISLCLVHPNNNGCNEFDYCLDGTFGQKKVRFTLLQNRITYPADNNINLPADIFKKYQQVILHTRSTDPFDEPRIERILSEIESANFILIGANIDGCIKSVALGLLQRGKHVTVLSDGVGSWQSREGKLALQKMKAKGAKLLETRKIAGSSSLRHINLFARKAVSKL
ncbi:MAG: isochorismatase family protein [Planctomycetes bacterium]|nr:isochorismatase family protein [Planctomycetota bacterium]MBL7106656.1 isochorismatase family protein [Phycisphaerae bacterium]